MTKSQKKRTPQRAKKNSSTKNSRDLETRAGIEAGQEVMCETRRKMEASNLGLDRGLDKLNQLLEATKPISCIKGKDADGGTVDFIDVPDNQAQAKALDMLLTLGDYYPDKKIKANVNVNADKAIFEAAREALNEYRKGSGKRSDKGA